MFHRADVLSLQFALGALALVSFQLDSVLAQDNAPNIMPLSSCPPGEHTRLLHSDSQKPLVIVTAPATAKLLSGLPPGGAYGYLQREFPLPAPRRWGLVFGDIRFRILPQGSYAIYMNLPEADASNIGSPPHLLGFFQFKKNVPDGTDGDMRHVQCFDITNELEALKQTPDWNQQNVQVTVVPFRKGKSGALVKPSVRAHVEVGTITLEIVAPSK